MPKNVPVFCDVFGVEPEALGGKAAGPAKKVPASIIDIVAEAVIDTAVQKSALKSKAAQALRQQLRYAAKRTKSEIGVKP